ncbi:MAG: hypothetical protein ABJB49_02105 [Nitrospirota bacterium]
MTLARSAYYNALSLTLSPSTMASLSKKSISQRFGALHSRLRQAFATEAAEPLTSADIALLERAADAVVQRGMATPAVLFLESVGPMNFLGSQALHFLTPMLDVVFLQRDVERVACLLERRDTLARLVALIEARAQGRPR